MALASNLNISFRLNNGKAIKDKKKEATIYIRVKQGRTIDFTTSIKIKVLPRDWDIDKQRLKARVHLVDRDETNDLLDGLSSHINKLSIEYKKKEKPLTSETIKKQIALYFTPEQAPETYTLFTFIGKFIVDAETKINHHTGKRVSKETIGSYSVTKNILKRFNDEQYKIDFEAVNLEFYYDFIEWCETQSLSKNYIGKHIRTLKTFLNEAIEQEVSKDLQFRSKKFVTIKEDVENIYLTSEELLKMWGLDLRANEKQQRARDLFLIGAYTGLRVSDYNNLSQQNIRRVKGVDILHVKTKKTSKTVAIPLHPIVKEILNRYNGKTPPKMDDQHINYKIKEVGELASFDEEVFQTKTIGGKQVTRKFYKYEMIKTHTARRSFCSNAYLLGMNAIDIMAISGHKTESAFLRYIKVTPEQTAIRMAEHPFFKSATILKAV